MPSTTSPARRPNATSPRRAITPFTPAHLPASQHGVAVGLDCRFGESAMLEIHGRGAMISLAALGTWGALVPLQLGWLPWARHAWGYNLWQYFPTWIQLLLAAGTLALCSVRVRRALLAGGARFSRLSSSLPASRTAWLPRLPPLP